MVKRVILLSIIILITLWAVPSHAERDGKEIYTTYCWNCHGIDGISELPGVIPSFGRGERLYKTDQMLFFSIWNGSMGEVLPMPAWKYSLSAEEVLRVMSYIRDSFQKRLTRNER